MPTTHNLLCSDKYTTSATIPHNSSACNIIQTVQFWLETYTDQNKQWHLHMSICWMWNKQILLWHTANTDQVAVSKPLQLLCSQFNYISDTYHHRQHTYDLQNYTIMWFFWHNLVIFAFCIFLHNLILHANDYIPDLLPHWYCWGWTMEMLFWSVFLPTFFANLSVMNVAARLIFCLRHTDHISDVLITRH